MSFLKGERNQLKFSINKYIYTYIHIYIFLYLVFLDCECCTVAYIHVAVLGSYVCVLGLWYDPVSSN